MVWVMVLEDVTASGYECDGEPITAENCDEFVWIGLMPRGEGGPGVIPVRIGPCESYPQWVMAAWSEAQDAAYAGQIKTLEDVRRIFIVYRATLGDVQPWDDVNQRYLTIYRMAIARALEKQQ